MSSSAQEPTPFDVASLVEYQEGAIVTRVVTKTPKGSVTAFAFDRGQEISEHTAPFDALVHVLEGEVEITISGVSHRLHSGQGIVMPADQPHALRALDRLKMMLTMIKGA